MKKRSIGLMLLVVLFIVAKFGYGAYEDHIKPIQEQQTSKSSSSQATNSSSESTSTSSDSVLPSGVKLVATGGGSYTVDDNKSTLNANIKSAPWVNFSKVDSLGRPGVANAWLNKSARIYKTRDQTGNSKTINPVGWHQTKVNGAWVYNRGHLLGYAIIGGLKSVDASEANRQNIITQTAWANQSQSKDEDGQNYYEQIVRKALDQNKLVRYQVKPYYKGSELVARGTFMQAKSSDGSVNFNVYVPNVQEGVSIDYNTGYAK